MLWKGYYEKEKNVFFEAVEEGNAVFLAARFKVLGSCCWISQKLWVLTAALRELVSRTGLERLTFYLAVEGVEWWLRDHPARISSLKTLVFCLLAEGLSCVRGIWGGTSIALRPALGGGRALKLSAVRLYSLLLQV